MINIKPKDLTIETALLKNMSVEQNYSQYIKNIDLKKTLPNTSLLLVDFSKYFQTYPEHKEIDFGIFYTHFSQEWHDKDLDQQDVEYYRDYVFPAILKQELTDPKENFKWLLKKQHVDEIDKLVQNGADLSKIKELIDVYEKKLGSLAEEDKEAGTFLNVDFSVLDKDNGIPWFLPSLQRSLMSLTMGQFVVVSADWGSGKSAFVISQLVHTLKWAQRNKDERPILYFNSEGTKADVLVRALSCLYKDKILGGFEDVLVRIDETLEKFKNTFDPEQIKVFQIADVPTIKLVEKKIKKYSPSLVIIDICDRLAPEGDVAALKTLYDDCRVIAGVTCPIIGTSQSGDTSFYSEKDKCMKNDQWLSGSKTYGSKTGKPGAADTIITIGKENEESNLRFISTPKKKRGEPVKIVCELQNQYSYFKELPY